MENYFDTDIMYLKGVGPKRAEILKSELGIFHIRDLLYHFPYKYIDKSRFHLIRELSATSAHIQLKGKITALRTEGSKYRKRLTAKFSDSTGEIELVWFQGINWVVKNYHVGGEYIIFGKPSIYNRKLSIAHPEIEPVQGINHEDRSAFEPQYNTTEKMKSGYLNSKAMHGLIKGAINNGQFEVVDTLPEYILNKYRLLKLKEALKIIHFPDNTNDLKRAEYRFKFEELFFIQLSILRLKIGREVQIKGFLFQKVGDYFHDFYKNNLPFELTNAQKRVVREIRKDLGSGKQMNRLLQGDVGSGKTLVALLAVLIALDNGFQTCLMAPTEILAKQHFNTISRMLLGLDINIMLLTGTTKKRERELIFLNYHPEGFKYLLVHML